MKYRWSLLPAQAALTKSLAQEMGLCPLLAQCLLNRGFNEPESILRFLEPRLKHLADPFLLPNMEAAVNRLLQARARGERLVIFGDYDVDGVTSVTILTEVLGALGWAVEFYLPHRMDEGYGLSRSAVENCLKQFPVTLLLAVDCGSTANETIEWLRQRGVDVLVLDHHQVSSPPPNALALVNPQLSRKGQETDGGTGAGSPGGGQDARPTMEWSRSGFRELCSAGLAFKLAHALVKRGRETGLPGAQELDLRSCLDLVALGTIADVVPLIGENRILVSAGLERLNQTKRPGLLALKEAAQITGRITGYEVGFQLGPRLNAAGRLENAVQALRLLLTKDAAEARKLAQGLDAQNRERQQIERGIAEEVIRAVKARFNAANDFVIVEGQMPWHIGVIGIVASRVLNAFHRPTIIFGGDGEEWRGSGRSIDGFDLAASLHQCSDLLVRHGGHAMAAGLAIQPDKIDAFRVRLNELARQTLKPEQLQPTLSIDTEIAAGDLLLEHVEELGKLQQTGLGNPPVQLVMRNLTHQRPARRMGAEERHAKLWVTDGRVTHEAVMWGLADKELPSGRFDLAFTPQVNEYNGRCSIQLKVLDWRPAD